MKRAIFRCDASKTIGTGHVVRCLTLADELKKAGWTCSFAVSDETPVVVPMLKDSGYEILPANIETGVYDVAIVDHYGLDHTAETKFRDIAARIIVLDDLADRKHDCDILMDQTHGRDKSDYAALVPTKCLILTGANYALLRDQFTESREHSLQRRDGTIKRIFVLLSGTDPDNVSLKVLEGLKNSGLKIDLVLGKQAAERMNISPQANVTLHQDVRDMASLMLQSDLAIGAGGTSSWERCCLGIPSIVIEIADNQKLIAQKLEESGAIVNLGWHADLKPSDIADAVEELVKNPQKTLEISLKAAQICDGLGVQRIVKAIEALSSQQRQLHG